MSFRPDSLHLVQNGISWQENVGSDGSTVSSIYGCHVTHYPASDTPTNRDSYQRNGTRNKLLIGVVFLLLIVGLITMAVFFGLERKEKFSLMARRQETSLPKPPTKGPPHGPSTEHPSDENTEPAISREGSLTSTSTTISQAQTSLPNPACETRRFCHACNSHSVLCPEDGNMTTEQHKMEEPCACAIACYSELTEDKVVRRGCVQGKAHIWMEKSSDLNCHTIGTSYVCFCHGELCNVHNMTNYLT